MNWMFSWKFLIDSNNFLVFCHLIKISCISNSLLLISWIFSYMCIFCVYKYAFYFCLNIHDHFMCFLIDYSEFKILNASSYSTISMLFLDFNGYEFNIS